MKKIIYTLNAMVTSDLIFNYRSIVLLKPAKVNYSINCCSFSSIIAFLSTRVLSVLLFYVNSNDKLWFVDGYLFSPLQTCKFHLVHEARGAMKEFGFS